MYHPTPWQLDDLAQIASRDYSANWSEMGTYKTTTLLWLLQERKAKNALIITSKNGKGTYFDGVPKALPGWKLYNVGLSKTTHVLDQHSQPEINLDELLDTIKMGWHTEPVILLIHYDCFSPRHSKKYKITERLGAINWDVLACDEAHKLKNRNTGWTKEIKKLKASHKHVMTGTGFVNNPAEIWSLLNFLDRRTFSSYWAFRAKFCQEAVGANGYTIITGLRKNRISEFRKLRADLGPRREMAEVHKGIAHPVETIIEVDLNATQRRMYNEIKTMLQTMDQQGESLTSPNVLSQLNRLRQISVATPEVVEKKFDSGLQRQITKVELVEPSSKLDAVMDILSELRWDDEVKRQVVVFSNFKGPLHLLQARLEKQDIPHLHMRVEMPEHERYRYWHDLFPKKEHRVFMSTLSLGGESINLACAQYLIFLDRSWSPKDMMQAVGRVYRPGQTGVPEIIYINARNTVDSYVKSKIDRKQGWFDAIFKS